MTERYIIAALAVALLAVCAAYVNQRLSFNRAWEDADQRIREAIANPLLTGINIGNGSFDIGMEGAGPTLLAGMFLGMFDKYPDAENYIECLMTSNKGNVVVTARKEDGKTPDAMRREAERKLAIAEKELAAFRKEVTASASTEAPK